MKYILFFILLFSFKEAKGQFLNEGVLGIGLGPETMVSMMLPKFGVYKFDSLGSFQKFYGIEGTIFIVNSIFFAGDVTYGFKKGPFTLETSLGYWYFPGQTPGVEQIGPSSHLTINPKIGLKNKDLWLRFGPSLIIYKNYGAFHNNIDNYPDLTLIGKIRYNFELLLVFSRE